MLTHIKRIRTLERCYLCLDCFPHARWKTLIHHIMVKVVYLCHETVYSVTNTFFRLWDALIINLCYVWILCVAIIFCDALIIDLCDALIIILCYCILGKVYLHQNRSFVSITFWFNNNIITCFACERFH